MPQAIRAVTMPKWGIEMTEGTINQWSVNEGQQVDKGDALLEVETDKIVNTVEAPASGTLRRIVASAGDVKPVGALIAVLAETEVSDAEVAAFIASFKGARVSFEPDALEAEAAAPRAADVSPPTRVKMSPTRTTIAQRLLQSKQTIPHYRLVIEVQVDRLQEYRRELTGVSLNDMLVRACALALVRNPALNATFTGEEILQFAHADIAVAVATDSGLITPIVRAADLKSLTEIARETADLADRARRNALTRDEITGGTFTVSNLGMFGVTQFDAIINPPQVAILAVGAVRNGLMMTLTLSADHRVVDGAVGAAFLATLKELIESPRSL